MKTTQKQFFAALKARAQVRGYGFQLTADGTYDWENGELREKRTGCCPVLAVARHLGKRLKDPVDPEPAAVAIGLSTKFMWDVVYAADSTADTPLRRKLLRTVGLPTK